MANILSKELCLPVETLDTPLHCIKALQRKTKELNTPNTHSRYDNASFPIVESSVKQVITLPHFALLGVEKDIDSVVRALKKVISAKKLIEKFAEKNQC